MFDHNRRDSIRLVLAAAAVGVATLPAAAASAAHSSRVDLTETFRALVAPSAKFVATGTFDSKTIGGGAVVRNVTAGANGLSVKFTMYTKGGSLSGVSNEVRTQHSDGSVDFKVTKAKITSGTGRFAHARGSLTGSGTEPNGNSPVTLRLHGTISY